MLKTIRFYILFFLLINGAGLGAKDLEINKVEFDLVMKKIVVNYNLLNSKPTERIQINLFFITELNDTIVPFTVTGDVYKVPGGYGKTITWDFMADNAKINNLNIKAVVSVKSITNEPGGPSNALLSLLVPGLGDRYVSNPRKSAIKPYQKTIATYGFIGAGIYNFMVKKINDDNAATAVVPENIQNYKDKSDKAALFAYIYTGIGVVLWGSDVVWVLIKSENKNKNDTKISLSPVMNPNSNGFVALSAKVTF
jgi:hypothetical protein